MKYSEKERTKRDRMGQHTKKKKTKRKTATERKHERKHEMTHEMKKEKGNTRTKDNMTEGTHDGKKEIATACKLERT